MHAIAGDSSDARIPSRKIEQAFTHPLVNALARASGISRHRLIGLPGGPVDWLLADPVRCNVCIRCIEHDIFSAGPFLRVSWRQAWRTTCRSHGVQLVCTSLNLMVGRLSEAKQHLEYVRLRRLSVAIENGINAAEVDDPRAVAVGHAIGEMETALDNAIRGLAPPSRKWGALTTSEFLHVVKDVTAWALTNFESFNARPAAEDAPNGVRTPAATYFAVKRRLLSAFVDDSSLRTLADTPEAGLRAAALWWAHVLLAHRYPYGPAMALSAPARQWRLLKCRSPRGLNWLHTRMQLWPKNYVRDHWIVLDEFIF